MAIKPEHKVWLSFLVSLCSYIKNDLHWKQTYWCKILSRQKNHPKFGTPAQGPGKLRLSFFSTYTSKPRNLCFSSPGKRDTLCFLQQMNIFASDYRRYRNHMKCVEVFRFFKNLSWDKGAMEKAVVCRWCWVTPGCFHCCDIVWWLC
jgi:hypothetical protein